MGTDFLVEHRPVIKNQTRFEHNINEKQYLRSLISRIHCFLHITIMIQVHMISKCVRNLIKDTLIGSVFYFPDIWYSCSRKYVNLPTHSSSSKFMVMYFRSPFVGLLSCKFLDVEWSELICSALWLAGIEFYNVTPLK